MANNPFALAIRLSSKLSLFQTKKTVPLLVHSTSYTSSLRLLSHKVNRIDLQSQLNILEAEWLSSSRSQAEVEEGLAEDESVEVIDRPSNIEVQTSHTRGKPIKIVLNEEDLVEKFVKGSGNGGQKINKTNSNVDLLHVPSGIRVQCQKTRSLSLNRKEARKLLIRKLDDLYNGDLSKSTQKIRKLQKKKANKARRTRQKYGTSGGNSAIPPSDKQ